MTCKVVRGDRDAKAHAVPCGGERDRRLGGFYLGPLGFDWLIGNRHHYGSGDWLDADLLESLTDTRSQHFFSAAVGLATGALSGLNYPTCRLRNFFLLRYLFSI
jgi:hypothetical protein